MARRSGAIAVAAGIFLSRIAGLVRDRLIAHYLGISTTADAFRAALRIPNVLQNLLGEGVLSASFIPVYAKLLAEGREADANRVARAVGTLLAMVAGTLAVIGVLTSQWLVDVLAPGFAADARELTIQLVRVMFPGVALLVISAWCLGVLNSHGRKFLPYVSPVLWNAAIITTAIVAGRRFAGHEDDIAVWLAWGTLIGAGAQLLVQLPTVIALMKSVRPSLAIGDPGVKKTLNAFGPVLLGRGSVQLSGYIDQLLASYLGKGIVAAMANAQTLYMLPVSLFGMAVAASELAEMSRTIGDEAERAAALRERLKPALRQVAFLVVPSAVAFVMIGGPMIALLFQSGRFGAHDTTTVWIILAGSALGLSAGTQGQVIKNALYALDDQRRPLYASLIRVAITGGLGGLLAFPVREALGLDDAWGAFALTASAGFAAWVEFALLARWLARRIGSVPVPAKLGLGCLAAAAVAGAAGYGAYRAVFAAVGRAWLGGIAAIAVFGGVYFVVMISAKVPEATRFIHRFTRRRKR